MRSIWIIPVLSLVGACGCAVENARHVANDCEHRIEATVDPVALQSWATNLLSRYSVAKTNYGGPFPPFPALENIWKKDKPSTFILGGEGQEDDFVCVSWGAAAGHRGLSVGRPSFVPTSPAYGTRMWKPGIYFWEQFH